MLSDSPEGYARFGTDFVFPKKQIKMLGQAKILGQAYRLQVALRHQEGLVSTVPSEYGGAESVAGEFDLRKQRPDHSRARAASQSSRIFLGGDRTYDLKAAQSGLPVLGHKRIKCESVRSRGMWMWPWIQDALTAKDDGIDKEDMKRLYEAQKNSRSRVSGVFKKISVI